MSLISANVQFRIQMQRYNYFIPVAPVAPTTRIVLDKPRLLILILICTFLLWDVWDMFVHSLLDEWRMRIMRQRWLMSLDQEARAMASWIWLACDCCISYLPTVLGSSYAWYHMPAKLLRGRSYSHYRTFILHS